MTKQLHPWPLAKVQFLMLMHWVTQRVDPVSSQALSRKWFFQQRGFKTNTGVSERPLVPQNQTENAQVGEAEAAAAAKCNLHEPIKAAGNIKQHLLKENISILKSYYTKIIVCINKNKVFLWFVKLVPETEGSINACTLISINKSMQNLGITNEIYFGWGHFLSTLVKDS